MTQYASAQDPAPQGIGLQNLPRYLFAPLPLFPLQILLDTAIKRILRTNPELFNRLGPNKTKRILIDPLNMPFRMLLVPDPEHPQLKAFRRQGSVPHDARIAGTALTLLEMIDGKLDGDALFFSRDLQIDGDTEVVVSLRNALDDVEASVADDVAAMYGPPGRLALNVLRRIKKQQ